MITESPERLAQRDAEMRYKWALQARKKEEIVSKSKPSTSASAKEEEQPMVGAGPGGHGGGGGGGGMSGGHGGSPGGFHGGGGGGFHEGGVHGVSPMWGLGGGYWGPGYPGWYDPLWPYPRRRFWGLPFIGQPIGGNGAEQLDHLPPEMPMPPPPVQDGQIEPPDGQIEPPDGRVGDEEEDEEEEAVGGLIGALAIGGLAGVAAAGAYPYGYGYGYGYPYPGYYGRGYPPYPPPPVFAGWRRVENKEVTSMTTFDQAVDQSKEISVGGKELLIRFVPPDKKPDFYAAFKPSDLKSKYLRVFDNDQAKALYKKLVWIWAVAKTTISDVNKKTERYKISDTASSLSDSLINSKKIAITYEMLGDLKKMYEELIEPKKKAEEEKEGKEKIREMAPSVRDVCEKAIELLRLVTSRKE
jgi:hypothetical protein